MSAYLFDSSDPSWHASEQRNGLAVKPISAMAMVDWAQRVSQQPELVSVRELAGLQDEELKSLSAEYAAAPVLQEPKKSRLAGVGGLVIALLGMVLLALLEHDKSPMSSSPFLMSIATGFLVLGGVAGSYWILERFKRIPLQQAYEKVGLYVSPLSEGHPWLYKALLLMRDPGAEDFRKQVLAERFVVRGVDYILMREIATMSENLILTHTARSVKDRVQGGSGQLPALPKREALTGALPSEPV